MTFTLEVKFTPLFPDPFCLPYPLWGGRWSIDNSWIVSLVDLLLADLQLADLLADVLADMLADLLAAVLLLALALVLLLLGAHQAALGAPQSDTMYFIEPSLPMATVISISVFTSITGLFGFMPCSVILLEKVVHNQGVKQ